LVLRAATARTPPGLCWLVSAAWPRFWRLRRLNCRRCLGWGLKTLSPFEFVHGLARRYLSQRLRGRQYVKSSLEVADYLIHSMRDLRIERLTVIYLDASHGIIDSEIVAEGTLTSNTIYPREIIKKALAQHAAALIIAHNHPSGNSAPSAADRHLTRNLFLALSFVGISLLDHFIVAGSGRPFSFADNGIMAEIKEECARLDETTGGRI